MSIISKLQSVFILLAAGIGILLGQSAVLSGYAGPLIEVFLLLLMFFIFLGIDIRKLSSSFANYKFSLASLLLNFVWTPLFAALLAKLFLRGAVDLQMGFLMLLVAPCTDWYLTFIGMSRGNVPLGSSVLPLNLILQVVLLPLYLLLFMGSAVSFAPLQLLSAILYVLIIPLAAANIVKWFIARARKEEKFAAFLASYNDHIQLLFLCLAVVAMFASQGRLLLENPLILLQMLLPLLLFFIINFVLALFAGKKLHLPYPDSAALLFVTSARNSPVSLAIATIAFPDRPLVALALVIGPLLELPLLAVNAGVLLRLRRRLFEQK